MDWRSIIQFIEVRDPGFTARRHGATAEQIAALQRLHPVALPHAYTSYLAAFGEDDGGFTLSPERFTSVGALLDEAHAPRESELRPGYPADRFIRIGGQLDERDDSYWGDLYLDLAAGDRDDPPLLAHEFIEPYDPADEPFVVSPRFSEYVQRRAFAVYEESRRPFAVTVSLGFAARRLTQRWAEVQVLLQKAGFQAALPGGPMLWIGTRTDDSASVCAHVAEALVKLLIVADHPEDCARVGEIVRDNVIAEYIRVQSGD